MQRSLQLINNSLSLSFSQNAYKAVGRENLVELKKNTNADQTAAERVGPKKIKIGGNLPLK